MGQAARKADSKIVDLRLYHRVSTAADVYWSEIAIQTNCIDLTAKEILLRHGNGLGDVALLACQTIDELCTRIRVLQEQQRTQAYDPQRDIEITRIANVLMIEILNTTSWTGVPPLWIECIRLSAERIGRAAQTRRMSN